MASLGSRETTEKEARALRRLARGIGRGAARKTAPTDASRDDAPTGRGQRVCWVVLLFFCTSSTEALCGAHGFHRAHRGAEGQSTGRACPVLRSVAAARRREAASPCNGGGRAGRFDQRNEPTRDLLGPARRVLPGRQFKDAGMFHRAQTGFRGFHRRAGMPAGKGAGGRNFSRVFIRWEE